MTYSWIVIQEHKSGLNALPMLLQAMLWHGCGPDISILACRFPESGSGLPMDMAEAHAGIADINLVS